MAKSFPSLLFIVCVAQFAGLSWGQSCYSPAGALSSTHFPCYPNAGTSLCCPMGWTCFSNNLCIVTDTSAVDPQLAVGTAQRGGCTNPAGDNDLCGDYCLDVDGDSLVSCGQSRFCCGSKAASGACNCDTGEGTFAAEGGVAKTIMGEEGMEKTATEIQSTSTSNSRASDTASTTLSTSTTASSTTSASKTSETAGGSTSNSAPKNTSSSTDTPSPASIPFTKKTGFKALIAIIAVAIVAILVAAGILFWRRRHRRKDQYEPGPFRDDSSSLLDLSTIPLPPSPFMRLKPDPYVPLPPTESPRIGSPTEPLNTRISLEIEPSSPPPGVEHNRFPFPMASIPKPYEGT